MPSPGGPAHGRGLSKCPSLLVQRSPAHLRPCPSENEKLSDGDASMLAQEFRGKVGTVRPHKRVHLGAEDETPEIAQLLQGLEDGTVELTGKLDLPLRAIAPPDTEHVAKCTSCPHVAR